MGVAPHLVFPVDYAVIGIERGARLAHHRRAVGLPRMLLLAHPLHAHRSPPVSVAGPRERCLRSKSCCPARADASAWKRARSASAVVRFPASARWMPARAWL